MTEHTERSLVDFIEAVGDETAASLFGITPRTAASWRRRERAPRRKQIPMIVEQTKDHEHGPVSAAGIYA